MSLFKSKSAPEKTVEQRYHVVLSDHGPDVFDLQGPLKHDDAMDLFGQRVARVGYPPDGPVRLRVIGEREYAAINAASATAFLGESAR